MSRRAGLVTLLAATVAMGACDQKEVGFFRLVGDPGPENDDVGPVFSAAQPPATTSPVSVDAFTIQVTDPPVDGGPGSGVDRTSVSAALAGGGPLPVGVELPTVTIDVSGLSDGPVQVVVSARDRKGNPSTFTFSHVLDRTPPPIAFVLTPPAADQTDALTYPAVVTVSVGDDLHFDRATVEARTPGTDGECGTADDGALPTTIIDDPVRTLPAPGEHTVELVLDNPVMPGGASQTVKVCWVATAGDTAVGPTGAADPNETVVASGTTIDFLAPPPTTGSIQGRLTDNGVGVAGATVELLSLAGTVLRTTTTDAAGFYRFTDVEPGDYRVRGTVDGRICGDVQTDVEAGEVEGVSLECPLPGGSIAGEVTAGGEGVGGAVITVRQGAATVSTATTADTGSYRVDGLTPGNYQVTVDPPAGFLCPEDPVPVGVQTGQTTTLNFSCDT